MRLAALTLLTTALLAPPATPRRREGAIDLGATRAVWATRGRIVSRGL